MKKKRIKQNKILVSVLSRYVILVVIGIFLPVFYKIFFPLTIWPSFFLLNLFYNASVIGNSIIIDNFTIKIVNACIAGSAYYLLLILNLTIPMETKKRFYSVIFSIFSFLILNTLRIFLLSILFVQRFVFFDIAHKLFLYALSIIFVIGIWFLTSWIFKIKEIPVYSDFKRLFKQIDYS